MYFVIVYHSDCPTFLYIISRLVWKFLRSYYGNENICIYAIDNVPCSSNFVLPTFVSIIGPTDNFQVFLMHEDMTKYQRKYNILVCIMPLLNEVVVYGI